MHSVDWPPRRHLCNFFNSSKKFLDSPNSSLTIWMRPASSEAAETKWSRLGLDLNLSGQSKWVVTSQGLISFHPKNPNLEFLTMKRRLKLWRRWPSSSKNLVGPIKITITGEINEGSKQKEMKEPKPVSRVTSRSYDGGRTTSGTKMMPLVRIPLRVSKYGKGTSRFK